MTGSAEAIEAAVQRITDSLNKIPVAHTRVSASSTEAMHALRGVGEEIGVHMPRFVSSFVGHLEGVGPILSVAFAPVAIIGMLEVLSEVPKKAEQVLDYLSGWGEKQRKIFEDGQSDIEKMSRSWEEFQVKLARAKGSDDVEALTLQLDLQRQGMHTLQQQIDDKRQSEIMDQNESQVGHQLRVRGIEKEIEIIAKAKLAKLAEIHKTQEDLEIAQAKQSTDTDKWYRDQVRRADEFQEKKAIDATKAAEKQAKAIESILNAAYLQLAHDQQKAGDDWEKELHYETGVYQKELDERIRIYGELARSQENLDSLMFHAHLEWGERVEKEQDKENKAAEKGARETAKAIIKQYEEQKKAQEKQLQEIDKILTRSFTGWIEGEETFGQAAAGVWRSLTSEIINNILKYTAQLIISEAIHKAILKEGILGEAAGAAAAAFHQAMKVYPPPLNIIIGGAEAAAIFAKGVAFASFDKGGVLNEDMMMLGHANEMMLPPDLSIGLQNMIRGGSPAGATASGPAIHYAPIIYGGNKAELGSMLRNHADEILRIVRNGYRNGHSI